MELLQPHSGTIKTCKEESSEEPYKLLGSERQEGYAVVRSILNISYKRTCNDEWVVIVSTLPALGNRTIAWIPRLE